MKYFEKVCISHLVNDEGILEKTTQSQVKMCVIELGFVNPWLFFENNSNSDNLKLYLPSDPRIPKYFHFDYKPCYAEEHEWEKSHFNIVTGKTGSDFRRG
ncbi:hypothetical protein VBM89_00235 [Mycoplasma sp. 1199]|uniref:hypothetical protein n=1 Tax=Mycoplasma sp. 1199 TaxID=3108526 RepID=UPI002B1DF2C9|nr:hypothetical protein [Mycoplasma sp. 1199]MEA4205945.1 hypothetical protein [Mycoplasma sp. 1199]